VDQPYSSERQIERPESDNCFPISRLSSVRAWLVGFAAAIRAGGAVYDSDHCCPA